MATRTEQSRRSRDGTADDIPRAALALARHWREVVLVVTCAAAAFALRLFNADMAAWLFVLVVAGSVAAIVVLRERVADSRREVESLARRDALTGIGNSRALRERLGYEVTRHGRHHRLLSVLLLDLDDFERINDRLGHPVGDQVLRAVADALTASVRGEDTVVRLAGDQFAVIAPDVDSESAPLLAHRIDRALANVAAGGEYLTASTGWAVYPDDGIDVEELLASAKAAELDAKLDRHGRPTDPGGRLYQLRPQSKREHP